MLKLTPAVALGRRAAVAASLGAAALLAAARVVGPVCAAPAARPAPIVLIHGGWRGGWCWRRVVDRLAAAGHPVWAPSLTGLGDRAHLLGPAVGLNTHVQDVARLIEWEHLDGLVLCGHSYGGMVTTGVIERHAPRIRAAVYLDAFVPSAGRSLFDHIPPAMRERFLAAAAGGDAVPPPPAEAFLVPPEDRAWVDALCTPQPLRSFIEALPATGALDYVPRRIYVRASVYDSPAFRPFAERAAADPAWRLVEMAGGHDLMIDAPDAVADILRAAAA